MDWLLIMRGCWRTSILLTLLLLTGCTAHPLSSGAASTGSVSLSPTPGQLQADAPQTPALPLVSSADPSTRASDGQTAPASPATQAPGSRLLPPPLEIIPTPSLPPLPSRLPLAAVHIVIPGPGSRLTSPVAVQVAAIPGDDRIVTLQLIGEDGAELASDVQHFGTPLGQRVGLLSSLDFKLPVVAETARLQVSTHDSAGRLVALASADLVLLSQGSNEVAPSPAPDEHFILNTPPAGGSVAGGLLPISGYLLTVNRQPIIFELQDVQSNMLAASSLSLLPPNGAYQPFTGSLKYHVESPTWARLTLRQADLRIPGDAILTSILVLLKP